MWLKNLVTLIYNFLCRLYSLIINFLCDMLIFHLNYVSSSCHWNRNYIAKRYCSIAVIFQYYRYNVVCHMNKMNRIFDFQYFIALSKIKIQFNQILSFYFRATHTIFQVKKLLRD